MQDLQQQNQTESKSPPEAPVFDLTELREMVKDLFTYSPVIYWCDFLISVTIAYSAAGLFLGLFEWFPQQHVVCYPIAIIFLYRVSLFMHEVVHMGKHMKSFQVVWNIVAGIPMLTPSFFYVPHIAHHNTNHYGTDEDGEYLPLGIGTRREILNYFLQVLYQPLFVAFRFIILGPLSFLHPKLRRWTLVHASSFVIDWSYKRPLPKVIPWHWAVMDLLCTVRLWKPIVLVLILGTQSWTIIPGIYALAVGILSLNYLRALAAHRFLNDGDKMTHAEQLLDSTNIKGDLIFTEIVCPLGLRFHALHHLFPGIPYHNLGIAHRRLMKDLPEDSPYRETVFKSWFNVMNTMRKHRKEYHANTYQGDPQTQQDLSKSI